MDAMPAIAWIEGEVAPIYLAQWSIRLNAQIRRSLLGGRNDGFLGSEVVNYSAELVAGYEISAIALKPGKRLMLAPVSERYTEIGFAGIIDNVEYRFDTDSGRNTSCRITLQNVVSGPFEPPAKPPEVYAASQPVQDPPRFQPPPPVVRKPPPTPLPKPPRMIRLDD